MEIRPAGKLHETSGYGRRFVRQNDKGLLKREKMRKKVDGIKYMDVILEMTLICARERLVRFRSGEFNETLRQRYSNLTAATRRCFK